MWTAAQSAKEAGAATMRCWTGSPRLLREPWPEEVLKAAAAMSFPNVDGWMLPESVREIFDKGKQNDVPLIAGSNAGEATSLVPWPESRTVEAFRKDIQQRFEDLADGFFRVYPANTDAEEKAAHYASVRAGRLAEMAVAYQLHLDR